MAELYGQGKESCLSLASVRGNHRQQQSKLTEQRSQHRMGHW